jgi:hypothetical protein
MGQLRNQRHENFCHQIIEAARFGRTQGQAYSRAGFKADGHAAEVAASRLMKNADIRARLAELSQPAVRKTRATVETLSEQFDRVFDGAIASEQFGAAGNAASFKAKMLGFMRERLEVGGPGSFESAKTVEEVGDRLIEDMGSPAAALELIDYMRRLVEERAAGAALDVSPTKEWRSMPERRGRLRA